MLDSSPFGGSCPHFQRFPPCRVTSKSARKAAGRPESRCRAARVASHARTRSPRDVEDEVEPLGRRHADSVSVDHAASPQGRPVVANQNGNREQGHEPTGHGLPAQRAVDQARDLTSDDDHQRGEGERAEHFREFSGNTVITTGELVATGGGKQYLAIMGSCRRRFESTWEKPWSGRISIPSKSDARPRPNQEGPCTLLRPFPAFLDRGEPVDRMKRLVSSVTW
jgi:hypothetical protein